MSPSCKAPVVSNMSRICWFRRCMSEIKQILRPILRASSMRRAMSGTGRHAFLSRRISSSIAWCVCSGLQPICADKMV